MNNEPLDRYIQAARAERISACAERRARLLARLSELPCVGWSDAVCAGYCESGILSWLAERGLTRDVSLSPRVLFLDRHPAARMLALWIARNAVA